MTEDLRPTLRAWLTGAPLPSPSSAATASGLIAAAETQGLTGRLAAAAREAATWPREALSRLRQAEREVFVRTVAQLDLATRALETLARRELRALPLKGAAVAESLYDSPALRTMSDVDVLALDDPPAALGALVGAGFTRLTAGDHDWVLRDPATGGILELHAAVTSCPGLFPLDAEAVWARRIAGGGQVKVLPGPEDLLVQLSLHAAFQHGLVLSLGQYLDFRRALELLPLDPDRLLAIARASRAERCLAAALLAAEAVVAAPLPENLRSRLALLLPRRLASWVSAQTAAPLDMLTPARPRLATARWKLCVGRRAELLALTLMAGPPDERLGPVARVGRIASRGARLLLRRP